MLGSTLLTQRVTRNGKVARHSLHQADKLYTEPNHAGGRCRSEKEKNGTESAAARTKEGQCALIDRRWQQISPALSDVPATPAPVHVKEDGKSQRVALAAAKKQLLLDAEQCLVDMEHATRFMNPLAKLMYIRDFATKFLTLANGSQLQREVLEGTGKISYAATTSESYDPLQNRKAKKRKGRGSLVNCNTGENRCGRVFSGKETTEEERLRSLAADGTIRNIQQSLKVATTRSMDSALAAVEKAQTKEREAMELIDESLKEEAALIVGPSPSAEQERPPELKRQLGKLKKKRLQLTKSHSARVEGLKKAEANLAAQKGKVRDLQAKLGVAKQTQLCRVEAAARMGVRPDVSVPGSTTAVPTTASLASNSALRPSHGDAKHPRDEEVPATDNCPSNPATQNASSGVEQPATTYPLEGRVVTSSIHHHESSQTAKVLNAEGSRRVSPRRKKNETSSNGELSQQEQGEEETPPPSSMKQAAANRPCISTARSSRRTLKKNSRPKQADALRARTSGRSGEQAPSQPSASPACFVEVYSGPTRAHPSTSDY